ncbi:hypothetical protein [Psychrobacter aquaticus]|uniref:Lipoprotein n=1 Tax=Psychrobacter aquaticus CMS 56 TaxID=1354303 RepID=U4T815_9GAMM|nr:hypothetical protein [Psychrobacter aquaticus]ERL54884.1 hypothetical protein M917_2230 [Psychrobacter aquaticus CMS 56]
MNKKRYVLWSSTIFTASLLLSGCQLLTGYQKINNAESANAWAGKIQPIAGEVNIACVGTYHCEIVRIDRTLIIAPDSHEPVNPSMVVDLSNDNGAKSIAKAPMNLKMAPLTNKNAIKIVPLSASAMPGLTNYYARVMPAKREIHVNFYPENNSRYIERFAMIHDFAEVGTYQLRAYQKKSSENSGSLLENASPEPLCIELLQGNKVQRRFCKQLGAERQGEFLETSMSQTVQTVSKNKKVKV